MAQTAAAANTISGPSRISVGGNSLLAAAAGLLTLLCRLRNAATTPAVDELLNRAITELHQFEQTALASGVSAEHVRLAHYALCASIDDVVMATPWGEDSEWARQALTWTFHKERLGGVGFFERLRATREDAQTNGPVLELMYFCLSLGFQGELRQSTHGGAELEKLRGELYSVIGRQRPRFEGDLSPHWLGLDAPYQPRRAHLPLWVAAVICLGVAGVCYGVVSYGLNLDSDRLVDQLALAPQGVEGRISRGTPAEPPPIASEAGALERLRSFLAYEINVEKSLSVIGTEAEPRILIHGTGMFDKGSALVAPQFLGLLGRIGEALKTERGPVTVEGHTDDTPIHYSIRYASNFQLSEARAAAASKVIAGSIDDPTRLTAKGMGNAYPLVPNTNDENRKRNRRIEVILHRQD
jgi:type VI secretion system protein ImpK